MKKMLNYELNFVQPKKYKKFGSVIHGNDKNWYKKFQAFSTLFKPLVFRALWFGSAVSFFVCEKHS